MGWIVMLLDQPIRLLWVWISNNVGYYSPNYPSPAPNSSSPAPNSSSPAPNSPSPAYNSPAPNSPSLCATTQAVYMYLKA